MADILLDAQGVPSTPSSGQGLIYVDTGKIMGLKADTGLVTSARSEGGSIASQGAGFASDTYLTDSDILIPSFGFQVRSMFRWVISIGKTAAGTAAPIYQVRIGSARTTADASRLTLTGPAQTAAADQGILSIYVIVRSVGASGVIQGSMNFDHNLAATGFANNATAAVAATSAGFDNTALAGLFIGLSINGGASAAWTVDQVRAEAKW
jgi:hypothetical protein